MSDNLEAIRVARTWLHNLSAYLATALYSLVLIETDKVDYMAVDRYWRCYWNPVNLRKLPVEQQGSILYHEVWHLLREHAERAEAIGVSCDGRVANAFLYRIWNHCADAEINDDAHDEPGISLPEWVVYPWTYGWPKGLTVEQYMELASRTKTDPPFSPNGGRNGSPPSDDGIGSAPTTRKEGRTDSAQNETGGQGAGQSTGKGQPGKSHGRVGGGSGSDGVARSWEIQANDNNYPGVSAGQGKLIASEVARQILGSEKGRGNIPEGAVRWAQEVLSPPKIRWTEEVLTILRGRCAYVAGRWDYSYSRPSRRQGLSREIVMPSMYRPLPQIAAVIDTSGSMSDKDTGIAVAELGNLIRQLGVPVHVLSVDSAAHHAKLCFGHVDRKLFGGGGTDMGVGIKAAMKMHPKPNVVVVFTDGLTGWPLEAPDASVVVVLISNAAIQAPSWARVVRVNPVDFTVCEAV